MKKMEISSVKAKEKLVRYRTTTLQSDERQQAEDDACQVLSMLSGTLVLGRSILAGIHIP